METRVTRLEERTQNMREDLNEMKDDLRIIRDAVVGARGGWKILLAVMGAAATIGATVATILPWLHIK